MFAKLKAYIANHLVVDARNWWRWYSTWAFTTIGGIQTSVVVYIPKAHLDAAVMFYPTLTWSDAIASFTAFLAVTGFIGRMISQQPQKVAA